MTMLLLCVGTVVNMPKEALLAQELARTAIFSVLYCADAT